MLTTTVMQGIAALLGLGGQYLVGQKKVAGFYVWLVSNTLLIAIALMAKLYILPLLYTVFMVQSLGNIRAWGKAAETARPICQDIDLRILAICLCFVGLAIALHPVGQGIETTYLQTLGTLSAIVGSLLVGRMRTSGFLLWLLSSAAMLAVYLLSHLPVMTALYAGYVLLNIQGLWQWNRLAAAA